MLFKSATAETAAGKRAFKTIDETHRDILDSLIAEQGLTGLWTEPELQHLNLAWHRLDVWKDVPAGLRLLRKSVLQATLSNGNVSLLIDLCRNGDMVFDTILSGEIFGSYKPDPKVYLGAAKMLGVKPEETAMVAARELLSWLVCLLRTPPNFYRLDRWDLDSARKCGLKTIYILRETEDQGKGYDKESQDMNFDLVVGSLEDVGTLFEEEASKFDKPRM